LCHRVDVRLPAPPPWCPLPPHPLPPPPAGDTRATPEGAGACEEVLKPAPANHGCCFQPNTCGPVWHPEHARFTPMHRAKPSLEHMVPPPFEDQIILNLTIPREIPMFQIDRPRSNCSTCPFPNSKDTSIPRANRSVIFIFFCETQIYFKQA